jgi:hypothetical protein
MIKVKLSIGNMISPGVFGRVRLTYATLLPAIPAKGARVKIPMGRVEKDHEGEAEEYSPTWLAVATGNCTFEAFSSFVEIDLEADEGVDFFLGQGEQLKRNISALQAVGWVLDPEA